jgi:hypothetical protein
VIHHIVKRYLIISIKNGLNAVLMNSALMIKWHFIFNLHNWPGFIALMQATGLVIAAREGAVWLPKLIKWTQTDVDPDTVLGQSVHEAKMRAKETVAAVKDVEAAAKDVQEHNDE